jgi:large subunit ribosomal protein L25
MAEHLLRWMLGSNEPFRTVAKHAGKKNLELAAALREVVGSRVRHLRAEGMLPAVLYGKGQPALNLQVPLKDFERTFREAGESTLIYVLVGKDSYPTVIKDVARDPLSGTPIHADFYKVSLTEKIKAMVPVVFVGESPAVQDLKAIFVRNMNELEVEALPQDLPHEISVDISPLAAFGDAIRLSDIKGHGYEFTGNADEIIATVQEPKSEAELEAELAEPTTDVSAVEEIKKEEKPAEEGEEAPAEAPAAPAEKKE